MASSRRRDAAPRCAMSLVHRKGVLITCDIPTMQVIKFMDKQEGGKMIIKELDERNVFIHRTEGLRGYGS